MKLIYTKTGIEVAAGDKIKFERHGKTETVTVQSIERPLHGGSTGRVHVRYDEGGWVQGYYPSVVDAHWIDRDDQGPNPEHELVVLQTKTVENEPAEAEPDVVIQIVKEPTSRYLHTISVRRTSDAPGVLLHISSLYHGLPRAVDEARHLHSLLANINPNLIYQVRLPAGGDA